MMRTNKFEYIESRKNSKEPLGLYIHIPFCIRKCPYCDFYSIDNYEDFRKKYIEALIKEIKVRASLMRGKRLVDTIFFGGGTPSLLKYEELSEIISEIKRSFLLANNIEISLECNPGALSFETLQDFKTLGVNRISLGVQSLNNNVLKVLGRIHDEDKVLETVKLIKAVGFQNYSLDLMFGVPNQTMDIWLDTVEKVIELSPTHISFYSLEFMEGTPFDIKRQAGVLQETSSELDREMYHRALDRFEEAGYSQYEISNMAKSENTRCRHNLKYWNLEEYMGLGVSAHSYIGGVRFENSRNIEEYINCINEKGNSFIRAYENTFEDDVTEYVFTSLRKNEGLCLEDFEKRFHIKFWDFYDMECIRQWESFVLADFVVEKDGYLRLNRKGMDISNRIMSIFV